MAETIRGNGPTISSGAGPGEPGGTVHAGGEDISSGFGPQSGGTARGTGQDIRSGYGPSHAYAGITFNPGDPVVVNGITYQYQGVISNATGEAEIFLLSHNGKKCVFKLYYPKYKPKDGIVRQLKQLKHEDIINVHDCGYYHDRFFEIMDYAAGGTLEQYLPIKDVKRIRQILAETVNAFKYCHGKGIVHKDIKPQNLYCKDKGGTDILVGDFGISTLLETGMSRHLTSQSLTVGYAAPEMYGFDGKAIVGREVDYYALGITIIHIWSGKSPFDGLGIHAISNLTTSGKVHVPEDMPGEIQKLVRGLITIDYAKRWGYDEVTRWLKGEDVPVHFQVREVSYPPYRLGTLESQTATTARELADVLKRNFEKGKKHLYSGKLSAWVNLFNQGMAVELDRIVEDDYPKAQDTGLQKAIYLLDPDEAPLMDGKKKCRTPDELADAIENNVMHYQTELAKPTHPFYLYLEAHDEKDVADTFRRYFSTFSAKKAVNTIILELRGRDKFKLGGELFFSPEELLRYKDRQFLLKELKDPESLLSLWIEGADFHDAKSRIAEWKNLDHKNKLTDAYARLKALCDTHLLPDEVLKYIQSYEVLAFLMEHKDLTGLRNAGRVAAENLFVSKSDFNLLGKAHLVPGEIVSGLLSTGLKNYEIAARRLRNLKNDKHLLTIEEYDELVKAYLLPLETQRSLKGDETDAYRTGVSFSRMWKACFSLVGKKDFETQAGSIATGDVLFALAKTLAAHKKDLALSALKCAIKLDAGYYDQVQEDDAFKPLEGDIHTLLKTLRNDLSKECLAEYEVVRTKIEKINSILSKVGKIPMVKAHSNIRMKNFEKELDHIKQIGNSRDFLQMKSIDKPVKDLTNLLFKYKESIEGGLTLVLEKYEEMNETNKTKASSLKSKLEKWPAGSAWFTGLSGLLTVILLFPAFVLTLSQKGCKSTANFFSGPPDYDASIGDQLLSLIGIPFAMVLGPLAGLLILILGFLLPAAATAFVGWILGRGIENSLPRFAYSRNNKSSQRKTIDVHLRALRKI